MNNYIIGSGLIAFIAKHFLPDYKIIPIGKSRYFQFRVSTCDDYIFCHDDISEFMSEMSKKTNNQLIPVFFKRALSYSGQIIFGHNEGFINNYLQKVYGDSFNQAANKLIKLDSFVYNISSTDIFRYLESKSKHDFEEFVRKQDKIEGIDTKNKIIHTKHQHLEYDNIINTIPLDAIFKLCGVECDLGSKDLHTFVVETDDLDFEGASELLVVDEHIDFFKCTRVGKKVYQFFSTKEISNLPKYLSLLVNKFDILSATVVKKAIPIGENVDVHKDLEEHDIISVGSNAQWDDMMDVSSCIKRIARISKSVV